MEWRHLSSQTEELPKPGISQQQTASLILDADRDGGNDFVIASRKQGASIVWYRRVNNSWQMQVIEPETLPIEAGGTSYDLDRDGDKQSKNILRKRSIKRKHLVVPPLDN